MKTIKLKQIIDEPKHLIKTEAFEKDGSILLDEEFIAIDEHGVVQLIYKKLPEIKETNTYKKLVKKLHYSTTQRVSGLVTTSTVFGYFPPVEIRQKPFCSSTRLAEENPKANRFLSHYCEKHIMPMFYEEYKHNLNEHMEAIEKEGLKKDWIMKGTIFTGGVINKANQLNYHLDSQNMKGTINAMVYFARDMEGGHLVCPKYDIRINPKDNYVLLFRNDLVHGVTQIKPQTKEAYRYSIVYYVQNRMQACGTIDEELAKARK